MRSQAPDRMTQFIPAWMIQRWKPLIACIIVMTNCGFTCAPRFGPQETNNTTYVDKYDAFGRPVKLGKVKKNVKVPVDYIDDQGKRYEGELDIGGWDVSPPPKKKDPEINRREKEKQERDKEAEKELKKIQLPIVVPITPQGVEPIWDGKWATPEEVKDAKRNEGISL